LYGSLAHSLALAMILEYHSLYVNVSVSLFFQSACMVFGYIRQNAHTAKDIDFFSHAMVVSVAAEKNLMSTPHWGFTSPTLSFSSPPH